MGRLWTSPPGPLSVDGEGDGGEVGGWRTDPQLWARLKPLARQMRKEPTPAEDLLWQRLRHGQLLGFKFRRQHSIERFIVDFFCPEAGLVVEVEGPVHQYQQEEDRVRQAYLESLGLRVLRFPNEAVLRSLEHVLGQIRGALTSPSPPVATISPSPQAERGPGGEVAAPAEAGASRGKDAQRRGQQGQALTLAIILLALAGLVASPVLIFVSTMLLGQLRAEDNTRALLAAEAGLEAVLGDLVRGADAVTATYPIPTVTVNDFTPTIAIATPAAQATPWPGQQYFDPGLQDPDLLTIPSQTGYLIHLYKVQPSSASYTSTLAVSWSFSPAAPGRVGVWKDGAAYRTPGRITSFPTEQPVMDTGRAGGSTDFITIPELIIDTPGVYTIAFFNTSSNPPITVTTRAFKPSGGVGDTWVYATAFQDYIVTSTVGGTAVKAYVRQTPGFMRRPVGDWSRSNISFVTNTLTVQTLERQ